MFSARGLQVLLPHRFCGKHKTEKIKKRCDRGFLKRDCLAIYSVNLRDQANDHCSDPVLYFPTPPPESLISGRCDLGSTGTCFRPGDGSTGPSSDSCGFLNTSVLLLPEGPSSNSITYSCDSWTMWWMGMCPFRKDTMSPRTIWKIKSPSPEALRIHVTP